MDAPGLKLIRRLSLPQLAWLFFFTALCRRLSYDGDIFWHIATGRWILNHGAIPDQDIFSHTMAGASWTAHEWLAAVLFACTHDRAGWPGLLVLVAASASLAYALILRVLMARMQPFYAVLLTALAFFLSVHHFLLRPHVLVMPILVGWAAGLIGASDGKRAPPAAIAGLMALWANLHGSFVFGLLVAGFFAVESVCTAGGGAARARLATGWARFLGLSLAAALLTPQGYRGLIFPVLLYGQPYLLDVIDEWQSPDFHEPQALEAWLLVLLAFVMTTGFRAPPWRMLFLLGLIHMGLHHIRHVAMLGLLSPLALAEPLGRQGAGINRGHWGPRSFNAFCARFSNGSSTGSRLAFLGLVVLAASVPYARQLAPTPDRGPLKAISVIRALGVEGPVFNTPEYGGQLIFAGIPPFIDGRLELYGESFVRQFIAASNLSDSQTLPGLLERYHIQWTLFEPARPINAWLDLSGRWKRVYEDSSVVVQIRCDASC